MGKRDTYSSKGETDPAALAEAKAFVDRVRAQQAAKPAKDAGPTGADHPDIKDYVARVRAQVPLAATPAVPTPKAPTPAKRAKKKSTTAGD